MSQKNKTKLASKVPKKLKKGKKNILILIYCQSPPKNE